MLAKKMAKEKADNDFAKRMIDRQAKEDAEVMKMEAEHARKMHMIKSGVPKFLHKDEDRFAFFSGVEDEMKAQIKKMDEIKAK